MGDYDVHMVNVQQATLEALSVFCCACFAKSLILSFVAVLCGVHEGSELLTASFLLAQDPLVENTG